MPVNLPQRYSINAGSVPTIAIDTSQELDATELITTPTFSEISTTDLTLNSASINSGEMTVLGSTADAGKVAKVVASGFVSGTTYQIKAVVPTDAGQTLVYFFNIDCA